MFRLARSNIRLAAGLAGRQYRNHPELLIKILSGTGHGGNRRRRTALEALTSVYTTQTLKEDAEPPLSQLRASSMKLSMKLK
jgi:hypothetical protein